MKVNSGLYERIQQIAQFLKMEFQSKPKVALILGTGMSGLVDLIKDKKEIAYKDIPNFPVSTVESHKGELVFGKIQETEVIVFAGRFHYYEGYDFDDVTFGVRVSRALGAEVLITTNAAGGMNNQFDKGDIMIVTDHINLMGGNPLRGPNDERLGCRFPDMAVPYDHKLIKECERIAVENKINVKKGVLVAVSGPCLETPAEYRFLRMIGADAVTMSTIPEVIVGVHAGFRCFSLSVITDLCLADNLKPVDLHEIIAAANHAGPRMASLLHDLIKGLKI